MPASKKHIAEAGYISPELEGELLGAQFETSPDGILVISKNGKTLARNALFGKMWRTPKNILRSNDDKKMLQSVTRQLKDPSSFLNKVKYLYKHPKEKSFDQLFFKDGRVFDRYSSPILGVKNNHLGRIWYFRDATERIAAEKKSNLNESKFLSLFNYAGDAIYILNKKGRFLEANEAAWKQLGYSRKQLLKHTIKEINTPKYRPTVARTLKTVAKNGSLIFETEHLARKGKSIPVEVHSRSIIFNERPAIISVCRDLTERNALLAIKKQIADEKQNFKTIFDNAGDAMFILPGRNVYNKKFVEVNGTACKKLGYTRSELLRMTPHDLEVRTKRFFSKKYIDDRVERMEKTGILFFQLEMRAKNGKTIPFELISRKANYSDRSVMVCIARDITDIKKIRELEETRSLQEDFLNIATHELRTPLSSIIGLSEIINRDNPSLPEQERHFIAIIHDEGERLARTIKQILEVTRNEHRGITINKTSFKLDELLVGLEPVLRTITSYRKATIAMRFKAKGQTVLTDREKISQVIYDLIDNAAKFGPAGQTITITVSRPGSKEIMIGITDQGPGIPKDKQEEIFKKFGQLDNRLTRSQEGIGLGLYSAKMIIEAQGGKIGVTSKPGHGATFWFTMPTP